MSGSATRLKTATLSHDPLTPLAEAIGRLIAPSKRSKSMNSEAMASRVADTLRQVLSAKTAQGRGIRMRLIRHLADLESQGTDIEAPAASASVDDQIGTAQAAEILGYSRPYVAMLIDQQKLKGATLSAGGHRRISRATVLAWKENHQVSDRKTNLRTAGQKLGVYKSSEADVVRRIKALAATRE